MNKSKNVLPILFSLIVLGIVLRIANLQIGVFHIAPIGALALFAGFLSKNILKSILVPISIMLFSDIILEVTTGEGFYDMSQPFVYLGFIIFAFLGYKMKNAKPFNTLTTSLLGSLAFWIISNLGVYASGYYGYNFEGLVNTFVAALPFLKNDYYSNMLFFNPILINAIGAIVLTSSYILYNKTKATHTQIA